MLKDRQAFVNEIQVESKAHASLSQEEDPSEAETSTGEREGEQKSFNELPVRILER